MRIWLAEHAGQTEEPVFPTRGSFSGLCSQTVFPNTWRLPPHLSVSGPEKPCICVIPRRCDATRWHGHLGDSAMARPRTIEQLRSTCTQTWSSKNAPWQKQPRPTSRRSGIPIPVVASVDTTEVSSEPTIQAPHVPRCAKRCLRCSPGENRWFSLDFRRPTGRLRSLHSHATTSVSSRSILMSPRRAQQFLAPQIGIGLEPLSSGAPGQNQLGRDRVKSFLKPLKTPADHPAQLEIIRG